MEGRNPLRNERRQPKRNTDSTPFNFVRGGTSLKTASSKGRIN